MKHHLPLLLALAALFPASAAAQQTRILTADKHNEYGLVYSLPVTSLRVEVTATHRTQRGGPYAQYAKRYVGTDRVITTDADIWTIDRVSVTSFGTPDPEQQYLMQLKPGALTSITVDENGMLLAINRPAPETPAMTAAAAPAAPQTTFSGKEYLRFVNEDFLSSQSSARQAQMLAESLMEVRDAKISLSRGTADAMPTDGRQLELMLQSLGEQEQALTQAFTGSETIETVTRVYTFTPGEETDAILFRMSDFAGFVDADDLRGDAVRLRVDVTRRGELPVDAKGEEKRLPKDAVVYALPGSAAVTVSCAGDRLWSGEIEMAQYGTVFGLAPSLFTDKKEPSWATFSPATGALLRIGTDNP